MNKPVSSITPEFMVKLTMVLLIFTIVILLVRFVTEPAGRDAQNSVMLIAVAMIT